MQIVIEIDDNESRFWSDAPERIREDLHVWRNLAVHALLVYAGHEDKTNLIGLYGMSRELGMVASAELPELFDVYPDGPLLMCVKDKRKLLAKLEEQADRIRGELAKED